MFYSLPWLYGEGQTVSFDSLQKVLHGNLPILEKKRQFYSIIQDHIKSKKDDSLTLVGFVKRASDEAIKVDRKEFEPIAFFLTGDVFFALKNTTEAIANYQKTLASAELYKETRMIINAANNLRYFASLSGDKENSLKYALTGLKASQSINNTRGISIAAMNVGHSLKSLNRTQEAIAYYRISYDSAVRDKNPTMIPNALISIGNAYNDRSQNDSALVYYRKAIAFCESVKEGKEERALASASFNIGQYYFKLNSLDSSIYYYHKALATARKVSDYGTEAASLTEIAKLVAIRKHYLVSNDSLFKALLIVQKRNVASLYPDIYSTLVENYKQLHDTARAFQYLEKLSELMSSSGFALKATYNLLIDNREEKSRNEKLELNLLNIEAQKRREAAESKVLLTELAMEQADSIAAYQGLLADKAVFQQKNEEKLRIQAQYSERKSKQNEKKAKDTRDILFVVSGMLLISTALSARLYRKNKKASREIIQANANELKAASAIKNHNLSNHYINIKNAIRDQQFAKLGEYLTKSADYFDDFYKSLISEKISLHEELDIFTKFYTTEKILNDKRVMISIHCDNVDKKNTVFLSDTLVSLYQNALDKAFIEEDKEYAFVIRIEKNAEVLACTITDNGTGHDHIAAVIRENSYLDMLRKRVLNALRKKQMKVDPNLAFRIDSSKLTGTTIQFLLPYETL